MVKPILLEGIVSVVHIALTFAFMFERSRLAANSVFLNFKLRVVQALSRSETKSDPR